MNELCSFLSSKKGSKGGNQDSGGGKREIIKDGSGKGRGRQGGGSGGGKKSNK